jgi:hypothetical protein
MVSNEDHEMMTEFLYLQTSNELLRVEIRIILIHLCQIVFCKEIVHSFWK